LMCARLGLYVEARLCMERSIQLRPDLRDETDSDTEVLAEEAGRFGVIRIVQGRHTRSLLIESQEQGGAFREPAASTFYPIATEGPGPLPLGFYSTAWLLPAFLHPSGHALMLGLGCGSGAVAMLHHFPDLHIEVVEADPMVIALARKFFPLVAYFEKQGRLVIHEQNAADMCATCKKSYNFLVLDLYRGEDPFALALTPALLEHFARLSAAIWINLVDFPDGARLRETTNGFRNAGRPFRFMVGRDPELGAPDAQTNWIASSETVDPDLIRDFIPFEGLDPTLEAVIQVRSDLGSLLAKAR